MSSHVLCRVAAVTSIVSASVGAAYAAPAPSAQASIKVPATASIRATAAPAKPFMAVPADATAPLPPIVLPYDAATKTGYDWDRLTKLNYYQMIYDPQNPVFYAVRYLREGLQRMTGKDVPVVSGTDFSHGIVLLTIDNAPAALKNDPEVVKALRNTGQDAYNANEAFLVRTEPTRTLIIANTPAGLSHGIVELLESVGYEQLGMGPDWTAIPDYHNKPLVFALNRANRPGFYIRGLTATSGQSYGVGTLYLEPLHDPADETVEISYERWLIGTRMAGQSMPGFPGHALQAYHKAVIAAMSEQKVTDGFLVPKTTIGPDAQRPAGAKENAGEMWINDDAAGQPGAGKVFISNGKEWTEQNLLEVGASLDLSVPLVRQVILEDLKQKSEEAFKKSPDDVFVFGTDAEDGGGHDRLGQLMKYQNWYPEYFAKEGVAFGKPYVLNGFKGLNQPRELWDPESASDFMFGFSNWLMREYDKWLASRPAAEQVTATGKAKRDLVRDSFYSYNYHDVPPDFNLDPRIRVMIAGYPKHRGWGKWKNFASQTDMAKAFQVMLPREPSGDYWIISLSYYWDSSSSSIAGSPSAATIQHNIQDEYRAGFKALSVETDFNFAKMGLAYYLYSKMLWNPEMTATQLDALRDRWLQRSFGSAWREMKAYYDFMTPDNFTINAPHSWAKAVRLLDAASQKLDPAKEPEARRRLDDVKQFWYFYYLLESGQSKPPSRAFKEFAWKGQMSYANAMHMVTRLFFGTNSAKDAAGAEFNTGPAHYTTAETQAWWSTVLDFWPLVPVTDFADVTLANGKKGKDVDVNDLVMVREFQAPPGGNQPADTPFLYNSGYMKNATFLTVAKQPREEIGFKLWWPYNPDDGYYRDRDVSYGVSYWNPAAKKWDELVDKTMTKKHSTTVTMPDGKQVQVLEVRYPAPQAGTYRIDVGYGGNYAYLTTLDYDVPTGKYSGVRGHTYYSTLDGLTQSEVYLYIPKGTKSLDLEVWDTYNAKKVILNIGLPATGLTRTRTVDVSSRGTHNVALNAGEDGSIAIIQGNGFSFPYLYSTPMLWAKSPSALLVPRAIAEADGLTIVK